MVTPAWVVSSGRSKCVRLPRRPRREHDRRGGERGRHAYGPVRAATPPAASAPSDDDPRGPRQHGEAAEGARDREQRAGRAPVSATSSGAEHARDEQRLRQQ